MMSNEQVQLIKTEDKDIEAITGFIRRENDDSHISSEYVKWWYFDNPSKSFSFWHFLSGNEVVGVATTNNFYIHTSAGKKLAAMPQKVVTSAKMRGKGVFGKLYRQTEKDNLENGADFFLTFTNEASTPIFLGKFGYLKGICPDVIFALPRVSSFFNSKNYESVTFDAIKDAQKPQENSFVKDPDYFRWRYSPESKEDVTILKVKGRKGATSGFIFLKKIYKKRIPLYVLLDLLILEESETGRLIEAAVSFASRKFSMGLLALDREDLSEHWQRFAHRRIKNRFNFLVKGQSEEETKALAETKFNFSFSELDFI